MPTTTEVRGPDAGLSARPERLDIVVLRPSDWAVLKMVRLRALRDSPKAFVAAHRFECRLDRAIWKSRLEDGSTWVIARAGLDRRIVGVAHLGAEPLEDHVGMDPSSAVRYVESVWVDPAARRQGVLRRMVEELEHRAGAVVGVRKLLLWVFDDNHAAWDAYLRIGFEPMGEDASNYAPAPGAAARGVWERRMSRALPGR